jgi:hypothetical protein
MHRTQSWKWDLINKYHKRHIYEEEPEEPPPYDENPPAFDFDELPSTKPQVLCSRCMLAVLKIYSNRNGTNAFGLFLPAARSCILCSLMAEIRSSSALGHEQRIQKLMQTRAPYPSLSRAPPAHMKDLVILWDHTSDRVLEQGASLVLETFEKAGVRAIPKQQLDPVMVRSWLRECESDHGEICCGATRKTYTHKRKIWLIDTRHFCLVQETLPMRYAAFSYVWGKVQTFRLQEDDIPSLSCIEGLRDIEDQLPLSIINAIEFVQSIGESYLWVDAVCIPQDNAEEMEEQIGHMASIYRSAVLTLVAISSMDANSLLPGVRPGTRTLRSFLETPDFTLAERLPSIMLKLFGSHYNTRAWTFQERLLSTRCLFFTEEQVFLQCQSGVFREDRAAYTPFDKLGRDALALRPLSFAYVETKSPTGLTGLAQSFHLFRHVVEEYTTKSLSFEADVLHAFTGIAEELRPLIQSPLVAGMPEKFFIRSMLFQPKRTSFTKRTAEMRHFDQWSKEVVSFPFPTWSWAAWVGPAEYENVGSIIAHSSQVQICTAPRATRQNAEFRLFDRTIEPQSHESELDPSVTSKEISHIQPFTVRFMADVDVLNSFRLNKSARGGHYLSIARPSDGLTCGLVRLDGVIHERKEGMTKPKLTRKETRAPSLILLCDIEQELIRQPEPAEKPWRPKLYHHGSPWHLCAVLYVEWHNGVAKRLGIGEMAKDVWQSATTATQLVYLV